MFYDLELVTQKKNIYEKFQVSNSEVDVTLRNSIL